MLHRLAPAALLVVGTALAAVFWVGASPPATWTVAPAGPGPGVGSGPAPGARPGSAPAAVPDLVPVVLW